MKKINIRRKAKVIRAHLKEDSIYAASKKSGIPYTTAYIDVKIWEGEIRSSGDYQNNLSLARGDGTLKEYKKSWAIEHGYKSFSDYTRELAKQRQKRPENLAFSQLIEEGLKKTGQTSADFAREIAETPQTVYSYKKAISLPNEIKRKKILKSLGLSERDLEERIRKIEEENRKI